VRDAANLIKVRERIKERYGSDLAFWIGVSNVDDPDAMKAAANNRMLFAVSGPRAETEGERPHPHNGYKGVGIDSFAEEVVQRVKNEGYVGLKIWFGPHYRRLAPGEEGITRIDDPRYEKFFSRLEKEKVLMASLHIADPNGKFDIRNTDPYLSRLITDPVYFWEQIRAFENVVAKYPNLTIVAAHAAFLVLQDAQVDYLRYMLSTYSNLHVDISAICHHIHNSSRNNIRDFFIEYQDRLVFGSDGGTVNDNAIEVHAYRYSN
jgi:predicted TIM-barrel fold metal-dependent hydrolase